MGVHLYEAQQTVMSAPGSADRRKVVSFEYAVGALDLPDVADDLIHLLRRDSGDGRHVAKDPVVLRNTIADRVAKAEVRVVTGMIDSVDQSRPLTAAGSVHSVTDRAVGVEQLFTLKRRVGQSGFRLRDPLGAARFPGLVLRGTLFSTSNYYYQEKRQDEAGCEKPDRWFLDVVNGLKCLVVSAGLGMHDGGG